jgi:hypothetical protein
MIVCPDITLGARRTGGPVFGFPTQVSTATTRTVGPVFAYRKQ